MRKANCCLKVIKKLKFSKTDKETITISNNNNKIIFIYFFTKTGEGGGGRRGSNKGSKKRKQKLKEDRFNITQRRHYPRRKRICFIPKKSI